MIFFFHFSRTHSGLSLYIAEACVLIIKQIALVWWKKGIQIAVKGNKPQKQSRGFCIKNFPWPIMMSVFLRFAAWDHFWQELSAGSVCHCSLCVWTDNRKFISLSSSMDVSLCLSFALFVLSITFRHIPGQHFLYCCQLFNSNELALDSAFLL